MTHLHGILTGLRHRVDAAAIRIHSVTMTGSEDRGPYVGEVPVYTVTLARDDDRTLTETIATGQAPWEPTPFDVCDTFLCGASLREEGIGDTDEGRAQGERFRAFVEGPDCWDDWLYWTDRDPSRQHEYDEPEDD